MERMQGRLVRFSCEGWIDEDIEFQGSNGWFLMDGCCFEIDSQAREFWVGEEPQVFSCKPEDLGKIEELIKEFNEEYGCPSLEDVFFEEAI